MLIHRNDRLVYQSSCCPPEEIYKFSYRFKAHKMTDLSSLFTSPPISRTLASVASFNPQPPSFKSCSRVEKGQSWRLSDLEASLKKSIKAKMEPSALVQEMREFQTIQKGEFLNKIVSCLGLTIVLSMLLELEARMAFHMLLLLLADLLLRTPFKIVQEPVISKGIRAVKPIIYAALTYYLLKWISGVKMNELNFPLTFASLLLASIYAGLQYFDPCFTLETEQLMLRAVTEQKILNKAAVFPLLLLSRIKFIKKMHFYLISLVLGVSILLVFFFGNCMSIPLGPFFQPINLIRSLVIFVFLEAIIMATRLIEQGCVSKMDVVRDKMPIFLTLLRLPTSPLNQSIQNICLLNLYMKMVKVECFLSTQTCKSLLFPTYMDLFNFYANSQLESLHTQISTELNQIDKLQAVLQSKKTVIDDLFIWGKKVKSGLEIIDRTVRVLEFIARSSTLVRVALLSDEQATKEKDIVKVSPKVVELLDLIGDKVKKIKSKASVGGGLKQELQAFENRLGGWLASMREGWI